MKLNILIAKPYLKNDVANYLNEIYQQTNVLLDSGAFTDWKKGKETSIDEFMKFITNCPIAPWRYFTLDVIGDEKRTEQNLDILYTNGFKPIPIFTRGGDPKLINKYYELSDLIGIGGLVGTQGNKGFVKGLMDHIGKRKVHWLGFTQNDYLYHFRPFSCDSSSWSSGVRFGNIPIYLGNGQWKKLSKKDFESKPSLEVMRIFNEYQEDITRVTKKAEWVNSGKGLAIHEVMSAKSWTRFQIDLERKLGIKYFLACASFWQVKLMKDAHEFWIKELNLDKPKIVLRKQDSSNILRPDKG